ncbi:MAG: hypothetical protein J6X18_01200 [Bacteroidales bacterium]|nr:hypothetical protein [Bacteroidales bacterium]
MNNNGIGYPRYLGNGVWKHDPSWAWDVEKVLEAEKAILEEISQEAMKDTLIHGENGFVVADGNIRKLEIEELENIIEHESKKLSGQREKH